VLDAGRPVGYVMARADTATAVEIHTLSNPSNRAHPLPGAPRWTTEASWAHLVNTAANLCLAVQVVHRVDAVIGDFQERNILVSDTTRVTLVDCDSMQFTDGGGRQFLCGVARPEFTAPEVAALNLRTQAREQASDYFALAVHIYLLLMAGNHPFMRGVWIGPGEQPSALELARRGDWAGGPRSWLQSHPLAPPPIFLPAEVQTLFERAFADGATDPARRPSAEQWRDALLRMTFTQCAGPLTHQVPVGCVRCPWCDIDDERLTRRREAGEVADQVVYTAQRSVVAPTGTGKSASTPITAVAGNSDADAAHAAPIDWPRRLAAAITGAPTQSAAQPSRRPQTPSTISCWSIVKVASTVVIALAVLALLITIAVLASIFIITHRDEIAF
jgi:eukaryotic-like serine/threonine-protein kinase